MTDQTPAPPHMTTPVSTPSPSIFLNEKLTQEGIFSTLLTTITPLTSDQARGYKLPDTRDAKYNAKHPAYPIWGRTYGGVFVTQSMACALLSLDDPTRYYIHQLQSVFVRGGKEGQDIQYSVSFLKTTKAFINSRVEAYQDGILLFIALIALITPDEANPLSHTVPPSQIDFASLPHPDTVPLYSHDLYNISRSSTMLKDPSRQKMVVAQTMTMPITTKLINRDYADAKFFSAEPPLREPRQLLYVRYPNAAEFMFKPSNVIKSKFSTPMLPKGGHDDDKMSKIVNHVSLHQQLSLLGLAYGSDYNMIPMVLRPQKVDAFPLNIQFSSLNHNITFMTNDVDLFNDWLIFETSSPFFSNSRCQLVGTFYTRDGKCVAHVTQETLVRVLEGNIIDKFPNPMQVGNKLNEKAKAKHGGELPGPFGMNLEVMNKHRQEARL